MDTAILSNIVSSSDFKDLIVKRFVSSSQVCNKPCRLFFVKVFSLFPMQIYFKCFDGFGIFDTEVLRVCLKMGGKYASIFNYPVFFSKGLYILYPPPVKYFSVGYIPTY